MVFFFFSSRRRHTRLQGDWSSDVCSSDLPNYFSNDAPQRVQVRIRLGLLPSGSGLWPTRVGLPHPGQITSTFEIASAPSRSTIPPLMFFDGLGRGGRLIIAACSTLTARF